MKSRAVLAGVVAAAIAVAAVLLLWPRSTGHEEPRSGSAKPAANRPGATSGGELRAGAADDEGRSPRDPSDVASPEADHRGETPGHPRPRRPGESPHYPVQASVIAGLRRALQPEIVRCTDEHGRNMAPDARIHAALEVVVRSGVLSVLSAKVEESGVPESPESSELIECARRAFAAAELRAAGHPDVDRHVVRLPFKVPVK